MKSGLPARELNLTPIGDGPRLFEEAGQDLYGKGVGPTAQGLFVAQAIRAVEIADVDQLNDDRINTHIAVAAGTGATSSRLVRTEQAQVGDRIRSSPLVMK